MVNLTYFLRAIFNTRYMGRVLWERMGTTVLYYFWSRSIIPVQGSPGLLGSVRTVIAQPGRQCFGMGSQHGTCPVGFHAEGLGRQWQWRKHVDLWEAAAACLLAVQAMELGGVEVKTVKCTARKSNSNKKHF